MEPGQPRPSRACRYMGKERHARLHWNDRPRGSHCPEHQRFQQHHPGAGRDSPGGRGRGGRVDRPCGRLRRCRLFRKHGGAVSRDRRLRCVPAGRGRHRGDLLARGARHASGHSDADPGRPEHRARSRGILPPARPGRSLGRAVSAIGRMGRCDHGPVRCSGHAAGDSRSRRPRMGRSRYGMPSALSTSSPPSHLGSSRRMARPCSSSMRARVRRRCSCCHGLSFRRCWCRST